jgi:hypothetical protein
MTQNEKERLLCYSAGIIGSTLANPNHNVGLPDWLIKRSIRQANKLIDMIMDDDKLNAILSEKE